MIQEHLLFRSVVSADELALCSGEQKKTFAELNRCVRSVAVVLRQLDLPQGSVVLTCLADKALDWILTLAIHHEGLVSISNLGYSALEAIDAKLIVSDKALQVSQSARTLLIDWRWLESLPLASEDFAPREFSLPNAPIRLFLTSGTTGQRKAVGLTSAALLERVKARSNIFEPNKVLTPMPLGAGVGFNNALLALIRGVPMYAAKSNDEALTLIEQHGIESFYGSPVQILALLRSVVAKGVKPASLMVVKSTGGPLSQMLIRGVRAHLCPLLINEYGATETGSAAICLPKDDHDPAITGLTLPGCQVQVVDEEHKELPRGEEGILRIRTPYMANAYHGDAVQSQKSFRDGYFYPGDRAYFQQDGQLVLTGRQTEIINRGGVKIDPAMIDAVMLEQPHVIDAAAFAAPGPGGLHEVAAAVVAGEGFDAQVFKKALHQRLGSAREPKAILRLATIPRSAVGKVQRDALAELLLQAARQNNASSH